MKLYKEKGQLIIDGENDFTIKKSPFAEKGFITAVGIKLSEDIASDGTKRIIRNFHQYQIDPGLPGKLITLWHAIKYIFMKGEIKL